MDRLEIQRLRSWNDRGYTVEFNKAGDRRFIELCDLALEALEKRQSLESVRSEALPNVEEIPEYFTKPGITEGLANVHPTLLVRQMANEILRLRALKGKGALQGAEGLNDNERLTMLHWLENIIAELEDADLLGWAAEARNLMEALSKPLALSPARVAEDGLIRSEAERVICAPRLPAPESPAKEQPGEQNAAPGGGIQPVDSENVDRSVGHGGYSTQPAIPAIPAVPVAAPDVASMVNQLRMHAGASDTHIPRPMLARAADLLAKLGQTRTDFIGNTFCPNCGASVPPPPERP